MSQGNQVKKKRGRKPKNNIVINENPVFDSNSHDNLISCVKCNDDIIISDENVDCEYTSPSAIDAMNDFPLPLPPYTL